MATRTTVTLVDDLDGTTAEETVRFGLECRRTGSRVGRGTT